MINEIVDKYEEFSDGLISDVHYIAIGKKRKVTIVIRCMNRHNSYEFENVRLIFSDILSFQFVEKIESGSLVVFSALVGKKGDLIVFDFFPLIFGGGKLEIDPNSKLMIQCKTVAYEILTNASSGE